MFVFETCFAHMSANKTLFAKTGGLMILCPALC